jgi:tricorn protease-like protein
VAVVGRGDIWSAPAENGTPRNMTRTDGIFERSAAWSPDGKTIAFFSDATGEYELYTMPADGRADGKPAEPKRITTNGQHFRTSIDWAPDSKSVVIQDKAGNLELVKVEDGTTIALVVAGVAVLGVVGFMMMRSRSPAKPARTCSSGWAAAARWTRPRAPISCSRTAAR